MKKIKTKNQYASPPEGNAIPAGPFLADWKTRLPYTYCRDTRCGMTQQHVHLVHRTHVSDIC